MFWNIQLKHSASFARNCLHSLNWYSVTDRVHFDYPIKSSRNSVLVVPDFLLIVAFDMRSPMGYFLFD